MCAEHTNSALLGDNSALLCWEQLQDPPVGLGLGEIIPGMC